MNYLKQFLIILSISFIGEILKAALPLPVPASIYGMAILFACLATGIIRLEAVRDAGKFLIETMPDVNSGGRGAYGVVERSAADACACRDHHGCCAYRGHGGERPRVAGDYQTWKGQKQ